MKKSIIAIYESVLPQEQEKYERPWSLEQMKTELDPETFAKLENDPVHRWRADTGIELIHKEPSIEEFDRICSNWKLMSPEQKELSDKKSNELFGAGNEARMPYLRMEYDFEKGMPVKIKDNLRCRQSGKPGKIIAVEGPDEHGWMLYKVQMDDPALGTVQFRSGELEKI